MLNRVQNRGLIRQGAAHRAFTIVELLVVIAIIVVLVTLTFVALGRFKESGDRVVTTNSLRQLTLAAASYSTDNEGRILPGYVSEDLVNSLGLLPRTAAREPLSDAADASSYVWRLASYYDYDWRVTTADYRSSDFDSTIEQQLEDGVYGPGTAGPMQVGLATAPSIGMNTLFLGGDDVHSDFADRNPWTNPHNKIAAVATSEVRNPSRIVMFAPTYRWNADTAPFNNELVNRGVTLGAPTVRPPYLELDTSGATPEWINRQYRPRPMPTDPVQPFEQEPTADYSDDAGLPSFRAGDVTPVAHLDGSTSSVSERALATDMRYWSPNENVNASRSN